MSIDIPLEKMTLADKLEAMELLWADISKQPTDLPSPEWHNATSIASDADVTRSRDSDANHMFASSVSAAETQTIVRRVIPSPF